MNSIEYAITIQPRIKKQRKRKIKDLEDDKIRSSKELPIEKTIYYGAFLTEEGIESVRKCVHSLHLNDDEFQEEQKNMHMTFDFFGGKPNENRKNMPIEDFGKIIMLPIVGVGYYEKDNKKLNLGLLIESQSLNEIYLSDGRTMQDLSNDGINHITYAVNTKDKTEKGKLIAKAVDTKNCNFITFQEYQKKYPQIRTIFYAEARIGAFINGEITYNVKNWNKRRCKMSAYDISKINYDSNGDNYFLSYNDAEFVKNKIQMLITKGELNDSRYEIERYIRQHLRELKVLSIKKDEYYQFNLDLLHKRDRINQIEKELIKLNTNTLKSLYEFYQQTNIKFSDLIKTENLIAERQELILELGEYYDEIVNPILSESELQESIIIYRMMANSYNEGGKEIEDDSIEIEAEIER